MESGPQVKLRPYRQQDRDHLVALLNNRRITDNLRDLIPNPYTPQDALDYIAMRRQQQPQCCFAIEYEGNYVGDIGLNLNEDVERLSAEIGYWLGEPHWGKGIASNALELATQYGFGQLGLIRIYAMVFENNHASMRVLEKCGYQLEGIMRKGAIKNGQIIDKHLYARIR